jgi:transposase-like protein
MVLTKITCELASKAIKMRQRLPIPKMVSTAETNCARLRRKSVPAGLGELQLRIPKLRQGSYFPPFLETRKTSEKAAVAVIQEAWIGGVSARRAEDLVQAMALMASARAPSASCVPTSMSACTLSSTGR